MMRMTGLASGMDTESIVTKLMDVQRIKTTRIENSITTLEWKQDKWKSLNSKIYSLYTGPLSKIRMQGNFNAKNAVSSNNDKVEVKAGNTVPEGTHSIQVKSTASAQFITGSKLDYESAVSYSTKLADLYDGDDQLAVGSEIKISTGDGKEETLTISANTTVGEIVAVMHKAGLNASFDTSNQRFFISSKESGVEQAFEIRSTDASGDSTDILSKVGLSQVTKEVNQDTGKVTINAGENVSVVNPSDAVIIYNGAEISGSSNNMTVNGLEITVKGTTDQASGETIDIVITKDTQAVYDMVKDFITSYNDVLKELNDAYYAEHSRGYDPLTDQQKEAMSESEIEKWENRIKDSLLRRDGTVRSIIDGMRSTLSRRVSVDGKNYALVDFGIGAVDYTEKGLLHIDGDEDDILVSAKEDKLMKAIIEDPDAVMKVFNTLANDLYETMSDQMKSTPLSSALTFYNDKDMAKTLATYKEDLSNMERRLLNLENRYYRQFAAMESALATLNAQSSSVMSLFGMNFDM